jgi:hypothetical protein
MALPLVKIYGERNTGTNFLGDLIVANLQAKQLRGVPPGVLNYFIRNYPHLPYRELLQNIYHGVAFKGHLGWKHSVAPSAEKLRAARVVERNVKFITLNKNPYSWLLSLYDKPYNYYAVWEDKPDFETFITSPTPAIPREHAPGGFSNPVEMWNQKSRSYLRLKSAFSTLNLRYEDLLKSPQETLEEVRTTFNLKPRRAVFKNREESTKEKDKNFSYYKNYYLGEEWKKALSPSAIRLISERLDPEMMSECRYEIL